ncbi:MAG TPA: 16S rRNA (cytidine(1402)-2'-O)-methyltransferase [Candidatus Limnocylindrales bacterium]|nr:16S rRNA (cytidine(1402)-2'-O)-methyltransferase [Candidatus Limnocylindrales bacterium]
MATPIGNLGDVTLRALEVLRAVPLIAAEDTRVTRRLLARHGIGTRTVSYHARSGRGRLADLLDHLREGHSIALVSDAGTPGVSDPGAELAGAWVAEGGRVVAVPGPSAVLTALTVSAVAGPRWSFEGFLPRTGRARRERLARIAGDDRATVLFEAPGRLEGTLRDLAETCGGDRRAAVCRELTKVHEQVLRDSLEELAAAVGRGDVPARGEVVVVVAGAPASRRGPAVAPVGAAVTEPGAPAAASDRAARLDAAQAEVERLVVSGMPRSEAAKAVASATGLPRRELYRRDPGRRLG